MLTLRESGGLPGMRRVALLAGLEAARPRQSRKGTHDEKLGVVPRHQQREAPDGVIAESEAIRGGGNSLDGVDVRSCRKSAHRSRLELVGAKNLDVLEERHHGVILVVVGLQMA